MKCKEHGGDGMFLHIDPTFAGSGAIKLTISIITQSLNYFMIHYFLDESFSSLNVRYYYDIKNIHYTVISQRTK